MFSLIMLRQKIKPFITIQIVASLLDRHIISFGELTDNDNHIADNAFVNIAWANYLNLIHTHKFFLFLIQPALDD